MINTKTQLKKEKDDHDQAVNDLQSADNKIKILEDALEKAEEKLAQTSSQLQTIETVCQITVMKLI